MNNVGVSGQMNGGDWITGETERLRKAAPFSSQTLTRDIGAGTALRAALSHIEAALVQPRPCVPWTSAASQFRGNNNATQSEIESRNSWTTRKRKQRTHTQKEPRRNARQRLPTMQLLRRRPRTRLPPKEVTMKVTCPVCCGAGGFEIICRTCNGKGCKVCQNGKQWETCNRCNGHGTVKQ